MSDRDMEGLRQATTSGLPCSLMFSAAGGHAVVANVAYADIVGAPPSPSNLSVLRWQHDFQGRLLTEPYFDVAGSSTGVPVHLGDHRFIVKFKANKFCYGLRLTRVFNVKISNLWLLWPSLVIENA